MTTTTQETAETPAGPVLGEIIVKTHDGAQCVAWTLGTTAVWHGLSVEGIAAAAKASADFLDGLSGPEKLTVAKSAGTTQIRITPHEWSLPLLAGRAEDAEALMIEVINAEGSIGRVA